MTRYDRSPEFGPPHRYDRAYGPRAGRSRWSGDWGGEGRPGPEQVRGYAREAPQGRPDGRGRAFDDDWGDSAAADMYGPARYGLGPYYRRLFDRRRPDEELKEEVEEALFYDTWVDAEAISVEVADGVATLSGDLPSYEEIRYAIDDVWDVDGIRGVRSELGVRAPET